MFNCYLSVHDFPSQCLVKQNKTVKNENKNTGLYPNCLVAKDLTYKGFTQDNLRWGAENYMFSIKFKERDQWGFF